jgi:hypothetical protein
VQPDTVAVGFTSCPKANASFAKVSISLFAKLRVIALQSLASKFVGRAEASKTLSAKTYFREQFKSTKLGVVPYQKRKHYFELKRNFCQQAVGKLT